MASQWPKPEGFDSDIDPLDLVDRFKEHYLSICRYTADNPTATAPASYVMDVMFQANKVVAMLAKNMSSVSKVCSSEVAPEPEQPPTNQLNLQDRLAVLSNMFQVNQQEQGPAEDPLACEDDVDALAQELSTKDILGPDLNPEDSEEDEDWESESSEDDSDDDYYEYGSFADESEEEDVAADEVESEGEHQNNVDEQGSYGDDSEEGYEEENEVESEGEHQNNSDEQDDTPDDVSKGEQQIKEELEDERDYEMRCAESNDDECDTTAHSESCEEYGITPSEVDEFSEQAMSVQGDQMAEISRQSSRQEKHFVRIGWVEGWSPYLDPDLSHQLIKEQIQLRVRNNSDFGVQTFKILYDKWYPAQGECDLFVPTAADRECLIRCSYSWLPFLENAPFARIIPESSTSPATQAHEKILPKGMILKFFRMTWTCGDGPYKKEYYYDILSMLRETLSGHSDPALAAVELTDLEIDRYCGDVIVYASQEDVTTLFNKSESWTHICLRWDELELHHHTGRARKVMTGDLIQPEWPEEALFRIRWKCRNPPYKKFNDHQIDTRILNMLHDALQTSGSPSLSMIVFRGVEPKWVSGDVDVYTTCRDLPLATKYAHLWFPRLIQGEHARMPGIYHPQSQAQDPVNMKSHAFKRNLEEVSGSQTNLSRSQSRSAKRKRQKIRRQQRRQEEKENQAPYMSGHAQPIHG